MSVKGLSLRGNIWWIIAHINGQYIRKSLGIPKECKKEAEAVVSEWWKQIALGNLGIIEKNPPIAVLFDSYLMKLKSEVSQMHYNQFECYLQRFKEDLRYKTIKAIKPLEVMNWLTANPHQNTARKIQIVLNAVMEYGVSIELLDKNPLKNLPRIKHLAKKREALTREQYIEFGKHVFNHSCGNLLFFLMRTGCRFSEGAKLKWKNVSLAEAKAIVIAENNKTRKTKEVPLSNDLISLLTSLKRNCNAEDHVFVTRQETIFESHNVRRVVRKIGRKIGRCDFTTHALRNTVVTLSLNAKANLLDVQQVVGHSEASTTSRYDNGDFERKKLVVESLPAITIPRLKLVV